jgi:hypothetical protein
MQAAPRPLLTRPEEARLIRDAQRHDETATTTLLEAFDARLWKEARRFAGSGNRIAVNEFHSAARLGFLEAVQTYDPKHPSKARLSTHAAPYVRRACQDTIFALGYAGSVKSHEDQSAIIRDPDSIPAHSSLEQLLAGGAEIARGSQNRELLWDFSPASPAPDELVSMRERREGRGWFKQAIPGAWGPSCRLPWVDSWYRESLLRHKGPTDGDRFNYTVPQTLGPVDWTNQAAWTLMFSAIATAKQRLRDEIGKYPTEPVEISEWPLASAPVHKYLDRLRHKEAERDDVIAARGWRSGRGSGDEDGAGKRVARFTHILESPKRLSRADAKADQALVGLGDGAETAEGEGHRPGRRHVPAGRVDRMAKPRARRSRRHRSGRLGQGNALAKKAAGEATDLTAPTR